MPDLTPRQHQHLRIEAQQWRHAGSKEMAVRESLGISMVRHVQVVNALLDRPEAEVVYPTLIRRLRRLRDARMQARSVRRLAG